MSARAPRRSPTSARSSTGARSPTRLDGGRTAGGARRSSRRRWPRAAPRSPGGSRRSPMPAPRPPPPTPSSPTRSSASPTISSPTRLHPLANPTTSERLLLMAVGGYGRGEMALHSDVDIAFVTPVEADRLDRDRRSRRSSICSGTSASRSAIRRRSRRRADRARRRRPDGAHRDPRGALRLGRRGAVRRGRRRASGRRWSPARSRGFVTEKLDERDARHRRMGDSRYVVEPNVKEGKGGLRDLHTLFWIGKYAYRVRERRRAGRGRPALGRRAAPVPARRALPVGGALPSPPRRRPRRGAADLRLSARDRGADELCRPARQDRRSSASCAIISCTRRRSAT